MTVTGSDVVRVASQLLATRGAHYDQCGSRCTVWLWPHCVDCSGLTSATLNQLGLNEGCTGSFQQAIESHRNGIGLSLDDALNTPGAFLWQGINQGQGGIPGVDDGHVGIAVGDGVHSLEARGHWAGIGLFIARSLVWDYQGMMPNVSRINPPRPAVPLHPLPAIAPTEDDPMSMVPLPNTKATPAGRDASARPVKAYNFALLEDGGRVVGDMPVDPAHPGGPRRWWAPAPQSHGGPLPVASQLIDVMISRDGKSLVARYGYPNGDAGTYATPILAA